MPQGPKKATSLAELQEQLAKKLQGNEEFRAASRSLNEKAQQMVKGKLKSPDFEKLAKATAARLIEQHEQKRREADRLQTAIRWIETKWGDQPCPYCQQTEWQVGTPAEIALAGDEVMSPAFPVMCGNCGHTTFVNAIRAGLLSEPEGEE
jgi:hypothetical protein